MDAITPLIPVSNGTYKWFVAFCNANYQCSNPLLKSLVPVIQFLAQCIALYVSTEIQRLIPWIQYVITNFTNLINILTSVINFIVDVFSGNGKRLADLGSIVSNVFKYVKDEIMGFLMQ